MYAAGGVRILVPRQVVIVPLPLGVVAAETGGEPAPEIQIDLVAFVSHKTHQLTICSFYRYCVLP
jgi:hypothetical protein